MNFKKLMATGMSAAMALSMAACSGNNANSNDVSAEATVYKIGIVQLVQHPALDAATQGFQDALNELASENPYEFEFDVQNASGDSANCATIVNGFVSDDVDLIMANATAPLQAAAAATDSIPVLGTSITDYATALEIENWTGTVGNNVSGTSDLAPLDQQADALAELFPADTYKKVGLLYCSAEPNSVYQITEMEKYLGDLGYTCEKFGFTDTNDVNSVTQDAADKCDVIYIPTDNTAAANTEAIANVLLAAKVPAFVGEEGICSGCGVATLSISYYDLGYATGKMAADILVSGADVTKMPVEFAPEVTKKYNVENAKALGITIPEEYVAIEE